jgi:hypothetical protein
MGDGAVVEETWRVGYMCQDLGTQLPAFPAIFGPRFTLRGDTSMIRSSSAGGTRWKRSECAFFSAIPVRAGDGAVVEEK